MALRIRNLLLVRNLLNETSRKICLFNISNQNPRQTAPTKTTNPSFSIGKEKSKTEQLSRAMQAFLQRAEAYG
jgi:hypothetical protein